MKKILASLSVALTLAAGWAIRQPLLDAVAIGGLVVTLDAMPAWASNCSSNPFTLQNGQTADATQVMANFNNLLTCANSNLAHNGANSDITSLSGLTTPLSHAQGGTVVFTGGTSTGSANAQVLSTLAPTGFALTAGNIVTWIPGFTNTGATTLNANATGATTVDKITPAGIAALAGGEIVSGQASEAIFDGTEYVLLTIPIPKVQTITVKTSGSGTYTTPTGAVALKVRMVGGGGGGSGSIGGGGAAATAGGDTTFGSLTASGGTNGGTSGSQPGAGGGGANGDVNIEGGAGGFINSNTIAGGAGGNSVFGGGGGSQYNAIGVSAGTNSGGGGGGGGANSTLAGGNGGGAGGYVEKLIVSPSATYSYGVGAGGSGGGAGTGFAGGAGAAGIIIIDEYYK